MQNYANHRRLIPSYHGVVFAALLLGAVGSFVNLFHATHETLYSASLITLIFVIAIANFFFQRGFALRAQDRAIRAEENFRYYRITGKDAPNELTMAQIIALRFASDEEYLPLLEKAVREKLSQTEIKKAIRNWKADNHRA